MRRAGALGFAIAVSLGWAVACGSSSLAPNEGDMPHAGEGGVAGEAGARGSGEAGARADGGSSEAGAGSGADAGGVAGADAAGHAGAAADEVRGRVVEFETRRPLSGRAVKLGGVTTSTDASGRFSLERPAAPFDIAVTDPDGSTISLFAGVTSSELVLPHTISAASVPSENVVDVRGSLSGEGDYPLASNELVSLRFLAEVADGAETVPPAFGPEFGPMRIAWDGPDSLAGTLVAVRSRVDEEDGTAFTAIAIVELTLRNGNDVEVELELEPAAEGRLSGRVELPADHSLSFVQRQYRVPFSFGSIPISLDETQASSFDLVVPDLTELGGRYCVGAGSSDPFFLSERCGLKLGASDVVLTLQLPPEPLEPADSATVAPDAEFTWNAFEGGIHRLALLARTPSSASPSVFLFTADTRVRFSDFSRLADPFAARATYDYSLAGYGRFESLDAALSEDGLAANARREAFAGVSATRTIVIRR
jgi:hypothetical protein